MSMHADIGKNPLPRYLTSFVGRDQEIAAITARLMDDDVRLLTLTGPGGAGKTRLAVESVGRLNEDAWDDIWFVTLGSIRDPALVLPAIAQALGLHQATARPIEETIAHFLRDRRVLLVIDNFEPVTAAAPDLWRILAECPGVTMLVTSRVALHISGEHLVVIHPLEMPGSADLSLDHLHTIESIQLFLDRANASGGELSLSPENASAISRICQRLDGLPLALELAAARSRLLTPAVLEALLEQGTGILSNGPRDAPTRHRSMHDAIAWSYDLLPHDEQVAFRQLAVFSSGFSLEAAIAVVELPVEILDTIASLVSQSLVIPAQGNASEPRFTMLETIREFAFERLEAEGEASTIRDRHAAYFLQEAIEGEYAWCMELADGRIWLDRLVADQANMREALAWLRARGDILRCLRLAGALGTLWVVCGNTYEGQRWLGRLLADPRAVDGPERASALATLSWICSHQGHLERARSVGEEALALARKGPTPLETIRCLMLSGVAAEKLNDQDLAVQRHREALDLLGEMRDPDWIQNWVISEKVQLGIVEFMRGALDDAEALLDTAVRMDAARGIEPGSGHIYGNYVMGGLGLVARAKGDHALALQHLQQHLRNAWRSGNVNATVHALGDIAGTLAALGQYHPASRLFGASEALHESYGYDFSYTFNLQRALGLPDPWAREEEPCGSADVLRAVLRPRPTPQIPASIPIDALEQDWADGRRLPLEKAVSAALEACAAPVQRAADPVTVHALTRREMEVLRLLADGRSNRRIAETLSLSERTIEHHVAHILTKLDLDSRTAAATFAVRNRIT